MGFFFRQVGDGDDALALGHLEQHDALGLAPDDADIVDRAADGSECRWARILAYEPPARVVFSWDIGPQWQVETDPELTSEVEVRFVAEGPDRTRVELEHRHLDRHGPGWQSVSDGVDGDQGWPLYLARYAALIEGR